MQLNGGREIAAMISRATQRADRRDRCPPGDPLGAPRDGTPIRILHGRDQQPVMAAWHRGLQGWVRADDHLMRVLHNVHQWVPE